ncbi:MAG TPA: penicillin-binding transpeptidase domain-containing protein [Clostridia bacterium]
MQKRLLAAVLSITFIFIVLAARLTYIQVFWGKELQSKAIDQWTRDLPLQAERGKILDANGEILATNYTTYSIYVRPNAVEDKTAVSEFLAKVLEKDQQTLYDLLQKNVSEVTIARKIEKEKTDVIRAKGYKGIYISEDNSRFYPYGDFLTQVIGFTNIDGVGQSGIENYYERYLKGVNGISLTQTDIHGIELKSNTDKYIPAIPGCDIVLTIDAEIQKLAEKVAADAYKTYNSNSASVLVMDVNTGDVVAIATSPSYDLNNPPRDDIPLLNSLTKNKLITDVFEPGSTFKIFTLSAALDQNKTSIHDHFYDPGYRIVDGQRIKCWKSGGHGSQSLQEAVNNSCNSCFVDLALKLGKDNFYDYINLFGFGKITGIDFPAESKGIVMNKNSVKNVDLARMGFGQAVAVTPLQLITSASAVVNGGKLMKPRFVKEIRSYDGKTIYINNPVKSAQTISESTSKIMRDILEEAVNSGSGKHAGVEGYRIGGKTGTAQKYENGVIARGKYVSSFIGFAPMENPQYAVLIIVDEPAGYAYYGSMVAAPYASFMFKGIFAYKGIAPSKNNDEDFKKVIEMPALIGLTYSQAAAKLSSLGLQFEVAGTSGKVIDQVPAVGVMLEKKAVTLIRLENED